MLAIPSDSVSVPDSRCSSSPGRYRLITNGIFFAFNSLVAISNGSVSPSNGTKTGAFILRKTDALSVTTLDQSIVASRRSHLICNALVPKILARSYFVK